MHPVIRTILQRLGMGLATLFVVSLILFSSIEFLPGDFGEAVLGQAALPETVAAFRKELEAWVSAIWDDKDRAIGNILGDAASIRT